MTELQRTVLEILMKQRWRQWLSLGLGLSLTSLAAGCQSPTQPVLQADCENYAEFAFVAAGAYIAGSDPAERDYAYQISAEAQAETPAEVADALAQLRDRHWFDREPERQTLSLPAFCMGRNLVTNADYQAFVQATGHPIPDISREDYQAQGFLVHPYETVQPYRWQNDRYPEGSADQPVVLVSYDDAIAYADWRGEQDGVTYRLPTAAEWEKAARGTDGRYFPWGSEWQIDGTNWAGDTVAEGVSAIATYPLSRSVYGLEDMAGNVFEFTSLDEDGEVIMKGCGWDDSPGFCRAAYRHDRPTEARHTLFGFRLVLASPNR